MQREAVGANLINIIFGMKIRQARTEAGLTLSEFAAQSDLSPSYVTEIERGRKYPRTDKIMKMSEVLGKEYDDLVSIKLAPSLIHLESALSSSIFQQFPFGEFGLEITDLVNLLTRDPDRVSALLHAIMEIVRRYDVKEEDFLRATLRSYQEIYENYFEDLEEAALAFTAEFRQMYGISSEAPAPRATLEAILRGAYGYDIDDEMLTTDADLATYRSVFVPGAAPGGRSRLFINGRLFSRQIRFLLARELGYQYLGLRERSLTSTPDRVNSFQQLLNDFRAAYFGGALLMPRALLLADIEDFFARPAWDPQPLHDMLGRYDITPEMLFYRFSELIPQFFGVKLHFLRFHRINGNIQLIKQLNMNQLLVPSGIGLYEHYCRRWLSVRLLQDVEEGGRPQFDNLPPARAQISKFLESKDRFLAMGFARPMVLLPNVTSSVVVGFRIDDNLKNVIRFVTDPAIPLGIINETCERCPLTLEECSVRAAEPTVLLANQHKEVREQALNRLLLRL